MWCSACFRVYLLFSALLASWIPCIFVLRPLYLALSLWICIILAFSDIVQSVFLSFCPQFRILLSVVSLAASVFIIIQCFYAMCTLFQFWVSFFSTKMEFPVYVVRYFIVWFQGFPCASSLGLSVYGIVPGFQGQLIWVAGSGSLNVVKFRLVAIWSEVNNIFSSGLCYLVRVKVDSQQAYPVESRVGSCGLNFCEGSIGKLWFPGSSWL